MGNEEEIQFKPDPAEEKRILDLEKNGQDGIFELYRTVLAFTIKYPETYKLPPDRYLFKKFNISPDRGKALLLELLGRGKNAEPFLFYIPSLVYNKEKKSLMKNTLFFRPPADEIYQSKKFTSHYIEKNCEALSSWISERQIKSKESINNYLEKEFKKGSLLNSQAGMEITRALTTDYEIFPAYKKKHQEIYIKPIIRRLIEEKKLILLKSQSHSKLFKFNCVYYNHDDEIRFRYEALLRLFFREFLGAENMKASARKVAEEIQRILDSPDVFTPPKKQILSELSALNPYILFLEEGSNEESSHVELKTIMDKIERERRLLTTNILTGLDQHIIDRVLRSPVLLQAKYKHKGRETHYLLHINNAEFAVEKALERYKKTKNPDELKVLSIMKIVRILPEKTAKDFEKALKGSSKSSEKGWFSNIFESFKEEDEATVEKKEQESNEKNTDGEVPITAKDERKAAKNTETLTDIKKTKGITVEEKEKLRDAIYEKQERLKKEKQKLAEEIYRKQEEKFRKLANTEKEEEK